MGTINPSLASLLDAFEEEETEVKVKKPKAKSQPKPKTEPKSEPETELKADSEDDLLSELELDDIYGQLADETLEEENIKKKVAKYKGKDRKIAPLKKRT